MFMVFVVRMSSNRSIASGAWPTVSYTQLHAKSGKTTESVHPRNFQYRLVIWHTKRGRKNFWGLACGKRGIALFGVKSIECCKKRLNNVIVFCASLTVHHNLLRNPPRLPATTLTRKGGRGRGRPLHGKGREGRGGKGLE